MRVLVSIDPGIHNFGVARWLDGVLQDAFLTKTDDLLDLAESLTPCHELVIEKMQVYRGSIAKWLIDISLASGEFAGCMRAQTALKDHWGEDLKVTYYLPASWKGQVKKKVDHERLRAALSPEELGRIRLPKAKKTQLDVMDAVSLGLAYLQKNGVRMGRCFR